MCGFSLSTKNKKSGGGRVLTQEYPILHKFGLPYQKVQTLGRGVRIISQQDFFYFFSRPYINQAARQKPNQQHLSENNNNNRYSLTLLRVYRGEENV